MAERKHSLIYYPCLLVSFLLQMLGNLIFIALYPLVVLSDVLMFFATFNYSCAKDDWAFWLTAFTIQFHLNTFCSQ